MSDPCPICGVRHRFLDTNKCSDRQMTESTLQNRVWQRAERRGWKVAHAGRGFVGGGPGSSGSWITSMAKGWPDLTLAKAGHTLIFMELKRETESPDEDQRFWLDLLARCGCLTYVIRPSDLREGRVNAILDEGSPL